MKKKIVYIAATLLLFAQTTFAQWAGAGTAQDPFRIYTLADLEAISTNEAMYNSYQNIHFELMNDIDDPLTQTICDGFFGYFHGKGYNITLDFYNDMFLVWNVFGTIDSVTFIGTVGGNFLSLFSGIFDSGKISHITCNLNIIPFFYIGNEISTMISLFCFTNERGGKMESCINYSNFHYTAPNDLPSYLYFNVFSFINDCEINSCINYGNIYIETNHLNTIEIANFTGWSNNNIKNCINYGDIFIDGVPNSITVSCFANANNDTISNCLNAGNIYAKKIDVLGVFANNNGGTVLNCLNTGRLTGDYIAGGIVGGTASRTSHVSQIPIVSKIENCLNAGYIGGDSSVGGIVGEFYDGSNPIHTNHQPSIIRNNIDLSKTSKHALFGQAITPIIDNYGTIIENNFYDKQMVTIPATPEGDVAGKAEGKLTTELTGFALQSVLGSGWSYAERRYPIPLGLEHHPAALLAATPVYLHFEDTAHFNTVDSVTHDFTVGLENGVQWQVANNRVWLYEENGYLQNIGSELLTCSLDNYTKDILLEIKSINPITTYTISGTVTCDNNQLAGVRISYSTTYTTTDIDGNYSFTVPTGLNVTITPSLDSYTFTPADTTITNIAQNIDNVNFTATTSGIAANSLNDIKIYPNPATDELYIISGATINSVKIVDVSGRAVFLPSFAGVGGGAINVSHLPAGFYFVKIHTDKGVAVRKIVKQ